LPAVFAVGDELLGYLSLVVVVASDSEPRGARMGWI
jgi:hypothetical protein